MRGSKEWIEDARLVLKPLQVKLNHVPNWFRKAVIKAFPKQGISSGADVGLFLLNHAYRHGWLDHWGSSNRILNGEPISVFVTEPYQIDHLDLLAVSGLADKLNCCYGVFANSWWFPGSTLRIEFWPKELGRPPRL